MTVSHDPDLLSKIQSSYLWTDDNNVPNNVIDISKEDLSVCNGLQQIVSPRFNTIMERPTVITPVGVPRKPTRVSLSDMHLKPSSEIKSPPPWRPNSSAKTNSEIPLITEIKTEEKQPSRFTLLFKNNRTICQIRLASIAFGCFILILCAITAAILAAVITTRTTTTTTSTTSTTTTSSTTTTTSSTTTTTSTTSTTTTPPATGWIPPNYYTPCLSTCINVSTVTPSTLLASWTFEQNTNDVSANGKNGQIINGAAFTTGYVGQAILLQSGFSQYVNAPYINFYMRSFTVEAWIYLNSLAPAGDLSLLGQYEAYTTDRFLHYTVRYNRLYMNFYADDTNGATSLTTYVWYHIAFVYDYSANIKYIYLNGLLDAASSASGQPPSIGPYLGSTGTVTVGAIGPSPTSSFDGLLDQFTISNRAKTACEVLNDASLVVHFPFDSSYNDIGPNSLTGSYNPQGNNGLSWVSGRVNQALNFNSSNSYFQSCGFYTLGRNQAYTIALWVNPSFPGGTIFHLSASATGSGTWCLPMIGFTTNGSVAVQTLGGSVISVIGPILPINTWTHIVQTYSSTNGLRLYINGGLYDSTTVATFVSSSLTMCVLLASSGLGTNCQTGLISMGPYSGAVDELYVYNRELDASEVCPLAHP